MNTRQIIMASALMGAAWLAFWADKTPDEDLLLAVPARSKAAAVQTANEGKRRGAESAGNRKAEANPLILRLREREPMEHIQEDALPESSMFASGSWDPPPPKPAPPPPPQAPPLPYTYAGKKLEAGVWEVYLAAGEEVRVVRPNSTLDGKYQIGAIKPPNLSLIYLPLQQTQTLSIGNPE